jgi:hypothetical protein
MQRARKQDQENVCSCGFLIIIFYWWFSSNNEAYERMIKVEPAV